MLHITIDIGKLTDWLTLVLNTFAFASGLVILIYTRRNVAAVLKQLRSQSQHQIIEAHKTLYMPIVQDNELSRLVFSGNTDAARKGILISMIINHASRIFADYENGISDAARLSGFRDDLGGLFTTPSVAERWTVVKQYHRAEFVKFVDTSVAAWCARPCNDPVYHTELETDYPPTPFERMTIKGSRRRWPWKKYGR